MDRYCLFGFPVSHSKSPEIHHEFARQTGEDIVYEKIEVEKNFSTAAMSFFAAGGSGANVTLPHKLAALDYADMLTGRAKKAGAVNTLLADGDGVLGDNTDGAGLLRDLVTNNGVVIREQRILVIGASGAARGILAPLLGENPSDLVVANRSMEKAVSLAREFDVSARDLEAAGKDYDLVINATPASLENRLPIENDEVLREGGTACDLVYQPGPTVFLQWAKALGAGKCIDGWGMLVEQAAESFELWRGVRPDTATLLTDEFRGSLLD